MHAVAHSRGGEYNVHHGYANAAIITRVLREDGSTITAKRRRLALSDGIAQKDKHAEEAAESFISAIEDMKKRFGIGDTIPEIQETDIPKLAHYADKEANPLYPVPKLMDARQLAKFYYMLMEKPESWAGSGSDNEISGNAEKETEQEADTNE